LKPTHFDITVFQKCYKKFVACHGEVRSKARRELLKNIDTTMKVFLDDFKEQSYKKCVDVYELAGRLHAQENFDFDQNLIDNMGSILMCFGEIEHELLYGERIPPDTEDEKRARIVA